MGCVRSRCFWVLALVAVAGVGAVDTRLADAAQNGDIAAVRSLLKLKADVNAAQVDGMTALGWAARNDDAKMAELLLSAGANAKTLDRYGVAPLSEAATNGNGALVEMLLKAGADANTMLPQGDTVLMLASKTGNPQVVRALLEHGAKVDVKEDWHGETALMLAAGENHAAAVKLLLEHGADASIAATHLEFPEMKKGPAQVFSVYPAGGLTALMQAARNNAFEATQALLEGKADPNKKSPQKLTAAMIAILNGHWDLAKLLVDRGSDPNDGSLPLAADVRNLVFLRPEQDRLDTTTPLDLIKDLLARGAKPDSTLPGPIPVLHNFGTNVKGPVDAPALYRAAKAADLTVMRLLVEKGADPKLKLKDENTALHAAVGIGAQQLMGDAALAGPKPAEVNEVIQFLLDHGVDVNSANATGMTPLHGAAQKGSDEIVQYLADHGAKLDLKDKRERTALDIANASAGKGATQNDGMGMAPRLEKHPSTVALLRKLMNLPPEDPNAKEEVKEEKKDEKPAEGAAAQ